MIKLINTKLLIAAVALLATIAAYAAYISHIETVKKQIEIARQKRELQHDQEEQRFIDQVKKDQDAQDKANRGKPNWGGDAEKNLKKSR